MKKPPSIYVIKYEPKVIHYGMFQIVCPSFKIESCLMFSYQMERFLKKNKYNLKFTGKEDGQKNYKIVHKKRIKKWATINIAVLQKEKL